MVETIFCLGEKVMWLSLYFVLKKKNFYVSITFSFIPPSDYVTEEKFVICFHEYVMKKYEVLASCHSNSKKKR